MFAVRSIGDVTRTHGLRQVPEYRIWDTMKQRCHNPNSSKYADYGGRGITVCDRWRESFAAFYADMGPRPEGRNGNGPTYSIDRWPNNDGDYEPGNCRWATSKEQRANRRDSGHPALPRVDKLCDR